MSAIARKMDDSQIKRKEALFSSKMRYIAGVFAVVLSLSALPRAEASIRTYPSKVPGAISIDARSESLERVISALALRLDRPVVLRAADRRVTVDLRNVTPIEALRTIALDFGLALEVSPDRYLLRSRSEPTLTIDVKDAEVRDIFAAVKKQCGIKNLMIDPDVSGSGTFLFREVPCPAAIDTILRTMGLGGTVEMNSILRVEAKP